MEKIVVGIDVGTTKIAVFIGQRDAEGKISIIGMGKTESDGVERGVVKNITLTANAIKLAVEQAEAMANYQVRDVYVGIAGHHIKSLHHRGNIMIPEDNHIITIQDVDKLAYKSVGIRVSSSSVLEQITPSGEVFLFVYSAHHLIKGHNFSVSSLS